MTALIEDRELRDIFRAESTEHTHNIEIGLLELERTPDAAPLLEEVFREAHSLKGASRMLGLHAIQNLAHEIENLLGDARHGKVRITAAEVAPQLVKLDQIRRLVALAVGDAVPESGGKPTDAASTEAKDPPRPTAEPVSASVPIPAAAKVQMPAESAEEPVSSQPANAPLPDFHIDTLRIESTRLDALLQLGGELVVSKGRIARWQTELDRLVDQTEYNLKHPDTGNRGLVDMADDLVRLRGQMATDIARLETIAVELEGSIRKLRLLPMSTLLELFPRMVHDLSLQLGKKVVYRVEGAATVADKRIIEEMKAPLMHLLRNCIDHGIEVPEERVRAGKSEQGQILIAVSQSSDAVTIVVSDDGRGLDIQAIGQQAIKQHLCTADELQHMTEAQVQALILQSGFSTTRMITDLSGRGVGMDVVRATVERLRGSLKMESEPGRGTTFQLRLPVSLTATRAMMVQEWGQTYAFPFDDIAFLKRLRPSDLHNVEGRLCFYQGDHAIALERLGLLLDRAPPALNEEEDRVQCVVLKAGNETFAVALDQVLDAGDIVVKPTAVPLTRVRNVTGLAVLDSGLVCPVLNPNDLLRSMNRMVRTSPSTGVAEAVQQQKRILLAEDSITTRMQERRILEAAGYAVETAVDGLDAWNKLAIYAFDAVVSDVQMPRMSGLDLAEKIRKNRKFAELPIVLVTSLATEEDRRRGLEAGADAYISKSEFDQTLLLDCLARLA